MLLVEWNVWGSATIGSLLNVINCRLRKTSAVIDDGVWLNKDTPAIAIGLETKGNVEDNARMLCVLTPIGFGWVHCSPATLELFVR